MKKTKENYRGWQIEAHNHPENQYRYFDVKRKNEVMLGSDILLIKKQIDAFLS